MGLHVGLLEIPLSDARLAVDLIERTQCVACPIGIFESRVELDPFIGQERRVRRENAIFRAEGDQLVNQLFVLAMEVDLVDQVAEPAHDPEPLDEVVARTSVSAGQLGREFELAALAADLAVDANRRLSRLAIAARPDDLAPFEQVGNVAGIGPVDVDARQLEPDVGQHRAGHLGVEPADVRLDVFVGLHIFAGSAISPTQPIEEPGVDVVADPEAKHASPSCVGLAAVVGDRQLARSRRPWAGRR